MKAIFAALALTVALAACSTTGDPTRDEARRVLTEAAVATAMHRFIDGDVDRAERIQDVVAAVDPVLVDGVTVSAMVEIINQRIDYTRYDPATAELIRASVVLAALELEDFSGGVNVPLSPEAVEYARRLLAAADRAADYYTEVATAQSVVPVVPAMKPEGL